jgi:hypothetical protein
LTFVGKMKVAKCEEKLTLGVKIKVTKHSGSAEKAVDIGRHVDLSPTAVIIANTEEIMGISQKIQHDILRQKTLTGVIYTD